MLWHFLEVWVLLAAAFLIGCVIGSAVHQLLSVGRAAVVQEDLGYAIAARLAPFSAAFGRRRRVEPDEERPAAGTARWGEPVTAWPPAPDPDAGGLPARGFPGERREPAAEPPESDGEAEDLLASYEDEVADAADEAGDTEGPEERSESPEAAAGPAGTPLADAAVRPPALAAPAGGAGDRLVRINGLGKKSAEKLNRLGIFHFSQIAAWTPEQLQWITGALGPGVRPGPDDWIGQAKRLLEPDR